MEAFLLVFLIIVNGVFAMAEIALVKSRKVKLQKRIQEGDRSAEYAIKLSENPTVFLSTIQIGITSIGILSGIVGESVFAEPLKDFLISLGLAADLARYISTASVVLAVTFFSIVFGELVPKRLGQIQPELIASRLARPMLWLSVISKPFVLFLAFMTNTILTALRANKANELDATEEEIHLLLQEGSDAGTIKQHEHQMVQNVFLLDERRITSIMVPRHDIVFLNIENSLEENLEIIKQSSHIRFPVCRKGLHEILGIINSKEILLKTLSGQAPDLEQHLLPAIYVPDTLTAIELLKHFRSAKVQLVFIVDEYGDIEGMVTLQDILEAITGELQLESLEESWAFQREDGSWLLEGQIPIPELKNFLKLRNVPYEGKNQYETLGGMFMLMLDHMPKIGDKIDWEDWRFEIVDMDGKRIDKVLATKLLNGVVANENPIQCN